MWFCFPLPVGGALPPWSSDGALNMWLSQKAGQVSLHLMRTLEPRCPGWEPMSLSPFTALHCTQRLSGTSRTLNLHCTQRLSGTSCTLNQETWSCFVAWNHYSCPCYRWVLLLNISLFFLFVFVFDSFILKYLFILRVCSRVYVCVPYPCTEGPIEIRRWHQIPRN